MILRRLDPRQAGELWPILLPFFRGACEADHTGLTPDKIKAEAVAGLKQIWIVIDDKSPATVLAAFATSTTEDGTVCVGPLAGDQMEEWIGLLSELERHAKEAGFCAMRIEGRRGWERVLKPYGYHPIALVLEKVI